MSNESAAREASMVVRDMAPLAWLTLVVAEDPARAHLFPTRRLDRLKPHLAEAGRRAAQYGLAGISSVTKSTRADRLTGTRLTRAA